MKCYCLCDLCLWKLKHICEVCLAQGLFSNIVRNYENCPIRILQQEQQLLDNLYNHNTVKINRIRIIAMLNKISFVSKRCAMSTWHRCSFYSESNSVNEHLIALWKVIAKSIEKLCLTKPLFKRTP